MGTPTLEDRIQLGDAASRLAKDPLLQKIIDSIVGEQTSRLINTPVGAEAAHDCHAILRAASMLVGELTALVNDGTMAREDLKRRS